MMKKWKKWMVAVCTASLLVTMPGMGVLADEMYEENAIVLESEEIEQDAEIPEEAIESDDTVQNAYLDIGSIVDEKAIVEEAVGATSIDLGHDITATFDEETGALELFSNDGTLVSSWKDVIGKDQVKSIRVGSGIVHLPAVAQYMFADCKNLTSLDLSNFDTSQVTDMSYMFRGCSSLTNLDLSSFNTSKLVTMTFMFADCQSLTNLDLKNFDTSQVKNMNGLFTGCNSLTELDLSSFDTSNVVTMERMFGSYYYVHYKVISNGPYTQTVYDYTINYPGCVNLETLDLRNFNTANVIDMDYMFSGCHQLKDLKLSSFDMLHVEGVDNMFSGCHIQRLETPWRINNQLHASFYDETMYDEAGDEYYQELPHCSESRLLVLATDLTKCNIKLSQTSYSYDGSEKKPIVFVTDNSGKTLTNFEDYEVTYANNVNAGTATVTVSGKKKCFGSVTKNFIIAEHSVADATIEGIEAKTYDGSAQIQNPIVKVGEKTLLKGIDYTISYANNIDAGTATIIISGKGNYCGSISKNFTINGMPIEDATVSGVTDRIYNGSDQTQNPVVTLEDIVLINGQDYTLSYVDNQNAGTATLIISGIGNYTGSLEKTFEINTASIEDATITGIADKTYTGNALSQNPTIKVGGRTLVNNQDYTLSYSDNTNAGTATVTITGKGNYRGEASRTFSINKAAPSLTFASTSVSKTSLDASFTNALTKKTDGVIAFSSSNTSVAIVDSSTGLVTIKGIGSATITAAASEGINYKAGSSSYTLKVTDGRTDVTDCTISLSQSSYVYDGNAKTPSVTVKRGTTALVSGTDYTITYSNNKNAGTATVKVTGIGNYKGTKSVSFTIQRAAPQLTFAEEEISKTNLDEGFTNRLTKVTDGTVSYKSSNASVATVDSSNGFVTIEGVGTTVITAAATAGMNYAAGSASYTLIITDGRIDLSSYTVVLSNTSYIYDGNEKVPSVVVTNGMTFLSQNDDYTVVYKDNINAGTATAQVIGKGRYKGSRSAFYEIEKATPTLEFKDERLSKTSIDMPFTNILTGTTDGAISYVSSDTDIAEVDGSTGVVSIKGIGNVIITATAAEGDNYKTGNASYEVIIIDGRTDLSDSIITLSSTIYVYDGKSKEPAVSVKCGGTTLARNTDYTVSYEDNTNAGTATVKVSGTGLYKGEKTSSFTIEKAEPELSFIYEEVSRTTLDEPFTNDLTSTSDGKISFRTDNVNVAMVNSISGLVTITGAGSATITANVAESMNYKSGSVSFVLNVETSSIADFIVSLDEQEYTYDGKEKTPTVTVSNPGNLVLKPIKDYSVSYLNNTNAGTATVKVKGVGNYKGEKSVSFIINKATPNLVFANSKVSKTNIDPAFTNTLTKETDGSLTFESSNEDVATIDSGTGLVTIVSIGTTVITVSASEGSNYKAGQATYTMEVTEGRFDISDAKVGLDTSSYTFDGKEKRPEVTVEYNNTVLVPDVDYIVRYTDNVGAGIAIAKVIGQGAFKGDKSIGFMINKASPELAFAETKITKKILGESFTNPLTTRSDGIVTYKSSNTKVAMVDSSGKVTVKNFGTATITAAITEVSNYNGASANYTLTVEKDSSVIKGFSDVQDPNHAYYKAIYWAADAEITKGYPDGTFGINRSCTRGEMMMFLWRYAGRPSPKTVSKSPFKDVAMNHAFYKAILWGSQKGITKGYSDGTFGINRNVSRGECMMFLWRLKGKPAPTAVSKSPFTDVPKNHVFYNAILWGAQKKITTGYTSGAKKGTFGINENCTRGQIVTFLYRAK